MKNIPVSWPYLTKNETNEIKKVFSKGWLGLGSYVEKFELKLSKFLESKNCFVCCVSTGTDALVMSLMLAGVKHGDEVILPSLNFIAGPQSVLLCGAKPVFCDIDEKSLCIDVEKARKLLTKKTKAIIAVDYSGNIANYKKLKLLKKENKNIKIIQDAAHSFASVYNKKKVGTFSDIAVFSFDPVKTITSIDGGAIVVKTLKELNFLKSIRQLGYVTQPNVAFVRKMKVIDDVKYLGMQNRMSNVHAAVGLSQMKKLNLIKKKKKKACQFYNSLFKNLSEVRVPSSNFKDIVPFIYYIRVNKKHRNKLRYFLRKNKILTGLHWRANHQFTLFKHCTKGNLSVTNRVCAELITLPMFYQIKNMQQKYIYGKIKNYFNNAIRTI